MSVFNQNISPIGMADKQCRRAIEGEIKQARTKLQKETTFRDAIYEYLGDEYFDGNYKFTLQELIGNLEVSIRQDNRTIDRLIAELESEKR